MVITLFFSQLGTITSTFRTFLQVSKLRKSGRALWKTKQSDELGSIRNEISQTKSSFKNVMCYLETFENVMESVKGSLIEIKNTLISQFELNDFYSF